MDNDGPERDGNRVRIAGWGNTTAQPPDGSNNYKYPDRMREANVPARSDEYAKEAYKDYKGAEYIPPLMVAAGNANKDTCYADSGGPLFTKNDNGKWVQIGITSYGFRDACAFAGYPGVYAEVNNPSIADFISNAAAR